MAEEGKPAPRPAYSYGPKGSATKPVMYQCPVSAIPAKVMDLLELWRACRLMRTLPKPGGYLDQPRMVQHAFPVFEELMQSVEAVEQREEQKRTFAAAMAAMVGARGGG